MEQRSTYYGWLLAVKKAGHHAQITTVGAWYESTGLELTYENSYGWSFYIPIGIPICHLGSNLAIHKPRCWGPFPRDGLRQATHFGSIEDQNFLFRPRTQDWPCGRAEENWRNPPNFGAPQALKRFNTWSLFCEDLCYMGKGLCWKISQAARVKRDCNMVCGCLWSSIPYW